MLFYTRLDAQENILVNNMKQLSICKKYNFVYNERHFQRL